MTFTPTLRRAVVIGSGAARAAPLRFSLPSSPALAAVTRRGLKDEAAARKSAPASSEPEPPSSVDALPRSTLKPTAPLDGPGDPSLPSQPSSSTAQSVAPLDGPLDPTMEGAPDPLPSDPSSGSSSPAPSSSPPPPIPRSSLAESYLDRTQVIDAGTESSTSRALLRQTEGAFPGEPGRARPKSRTFKTSAERKRERMFNYVLGAGVVGGLYFAWELGRDWDSETEAVRLGSDNDVPGMAGRPRRAAARARAWWNKSNEPLWDPLLPAPLPPPHQKPYTLVIDLECLIEPVWDAKHGWRTIKRPGVDYFLSYLAELYEIVVFTTYPAYTAQPLLDLVDSLQLYITYRLFKESTHTVKGHNIKDLNYLGRDLSKTLVLDRDPANFSLHPDNGVIVPPLTGKPNDTGLVQFIPFLEAVALLGVQDVRTVVRKYGQTETAQNFRLEQARLRMQHIADWKAKGGKPLTAASEGGFLRSIGTSLGLTPPQPSAPLPTFADGAPPMPLDLMRARQQRIYAENAKFFAENRAAMEAQQKADQEKAMREMKTSLLGFMSGSLGQPAPGEQAQ